MCLYMCMSVRLCVYIYWDRRRKSLSYREGEESNVTCIQDSMLYRLSSKILVVYFHLKECNYFPRECCRRKGVLRTESGKGNEQQ